MPKIEPLNPGFSTADTSYPKIRASAGTLHVTFNDWKEREVRVTFEEVCAFHWQEAESLLPNEPYDGSCEIIDSEWVSQHGERPLLSGQNSIRHLRFNFNNRGKLEVLCATFFST